MIKSTASQSAVFEYTQAEITDAVVSGMNNIDIAGNRLSVQRVPESSASVLLKPKHSASPNSSQNMVVDENAIMNFYSKNEPTCVVQLSNMTSAEDLADNQLYEELIEDISEECSNHAVVKSVTIPREKSIFDSSFLGEVFVYVSDVIGAQKVVKAVRGRKFNGKIVGATFYPEELYLSEVIFCIIF